MRASPAQAGLLLLLLGCAHRERREGSEAPARAVEVRYRPGVPPDADADWLVTSIPGGQWDRGLASAASELLSLATDRKAALDPGSTLAAAARAGFPGQARFSRALTGGARPDRTIAEILAATAGESAVDLGLAVRRYGDGVALWIVAWAPRRVDMDPIPRDLALDAPLALRVDLPKEEQATPALYLAPPDGPVERLDLSSGVSRWLDRFHAPGEYRLSVTLNDADAQQVALLFSVFVDSPPPAPRPLSLPPAQAPNPVAAEPWLVEAINQLRVEHGLKPASNFPLYTPLAREHAALMASVGRLGHVLPGLSEGVEARARAISHPRAEHHEAVVAAASAEDALAMLAGSPAHLAQVLCAPCTHMSVGAALEPVLDRAPRLFVTVELLRFPGGEPKAIDHYNR